MGNDNYIYVILIKALTGLGKLTRKISNYEYTHIAISFDEELVDFITFSRRKHYSPFNAGFMHEKREHYAFGENESVKAKVYKIPVSKFDMDAIKEYVNQIENDKEYIFNLYSMITMPVFHGFRIYKAYNCMSFVSKIIELSHCVTLKKDYYRYDMKEIEKLLEAYSRNEYDLEKHSKDDDYMKRDGIGVNLKEFFLLNGKLLYRMLFKWKDRFDIT